MARTTRGKGTREEVRAGALDALNVTAQQHADTVRIALDALLAHVERLTAERKHHLRLLALRDDEYRSSMREEAIARAEAAEREVERLTAENGRMEQELDAMDSRRAFEWERAEAAEALAERRGAAATLASSELDWCIGYASTVEHKAWRERLLKRLHVARAALADEGPA